MIITPHISLMGNELGADVMLLALLMLFISASVVAVSVQRETGCVVSIVLASLLLLLVTCMHALMTVALVLFLALLLASLGTSVSVSRHHASIASVSASASLLLKASLLFIVLILIASSTPPSLAPLLTCLGHLLGFEEVLLASLAPPLGPALWAVVLLCAMCQVCLNKH